MPTPKRRTADYGVLEERLTNHMAHDENREVEWSKKWADMVEFWKKMDEKIDQLDIKMITFADIPDRVKALWDSKNKQNGVVAATAVIGGALGGIIAWLTELIHR